MTLPELRMALAKAKIDLRQARDTHQTRKAICEYTALLAGGPNKEARDAAAAHALRNDPAVTEALDDLRDAEADVERIEAQIAGEEDRYRERRLQISERQAQALERFADALSRVPPTIAAAATGIEEWFGDSGLHGSTAAYASRREGRSE